MIVNPVEPPQTLALCTVSARGDMLHLDDGGIFAAARAVDPLHSGGDLHPLQIEVSCLSFVTCPSVLVKTIFFARWPI
jgi:hypothetical protein